MPDSHLSVTSKQLKQRALLVQRGGVRAAVLGVNDGLVSTVCLVVGVAATGAQASTVLVTGLAGLLAGAISMAAGEWISVKAQVELFEGVLTDLKASMHDEKDHLVHSLAHTLASGGMEIHTAHQASKDIARNDEHFVAIYTSQVIGMNKDELGSPWQAAIASFALFALGALVPILPWLVGGGMLALVASVIATSLSGLVVGGYIARSSGKSIPYGSIRQLLIILGSSFVTYAIGYIFGVAVS